MKRLLPLLILCCFLQLAIADTPANKAFDTYKNGFVERLWKIYPMYATAVGYHKYDSVLPVPDKAFRVKEIAFANSELKKLKAHRQEQLSDLNKIDFRLIETQLKQTLWENSGLKAYEWNPATYNLGSAFSYILYESYEPLAKRMHSIYLKLRNVPEYYEAAKKNLVNPPQEYIDLAIQQNEGTLSIFESEINDSARLLNFPQKQMMMLQKRTLDAADAIRSYIKFLKEFKNTSPRSFRLGSELYAKKFEYEIQSEHTPDQMFQFAMDRKSYLHDEMDKLAKELWPKYFGTEEMPADRLVLIKKVIDTISIFHCKPEDFLSTIEQQLPELTAFVMEKDLLYMDPTKPLKVRKEPGYMAGVAGASVSSPGPYEKNGKAYYNVGTLEGWSAEKAESYLREYNDYVLQILNIHEAIPGHYVQLIYSNKAPSIIKSILQNSTMIEGWAVYAELMMLENGYKNSPEMWLLYNKWNLRSVCNTILDISVHTKNMNKEEAMDLLIRQAFQQKTEAENKWRRVEVTNVQLCCYFTGFKEIIDLREAYKQQQGPAYTLKSFNERFLSYGSAPVKYIKELMLKK